MTCDPTAPIPVELAERLAVWLAVVDAWHIPYRATDDWRAHSRVGHAVIDYQDAGMPVVLGGDRNQRQTLSRQLHALPDSILTVNRRHKPLEVRFTNAGADLVRKLCGGPCLADAWPLFRKIGKAIAAEEKRDPEFCQGSIRETILTKCSRWRIQAERRPVDFELAARPLFSSAYLHTASTSGQTIVYSITDSGQAALAGKRPKPPAVEPDQFLTEVYNQVFADELDHRGGTEILPESIAQHLRTLEFQRQHGMGDFGDD